MWLGQASPLSLLADWIRLNNMKFALLGTDRECQTLAQAAKAVGHQVVPDPGEQWQTLLEQDASESGGVDAVILGRDTASDMDTAGDLRGQQLNQLTRSGMPVLTSFPLVDSVLTYYEIDMARGESHAVLQHYNPLVEQQPTISECAQWIAEGHPDLGAVEQVVWERPLAERTRERVLWHFARDVELLSLVAGSLNRLGALGSPDEAATYAGLSVQLLGKRGVPVRWQVGPVEESTQSTLVLVAQRGKVCIEFDEAGSAVKRAISRKGESVAEVPTAVDSAGERIARFVAAVEAGQGSASTWAQALAAMELTDTIEISLRRGRMIEVHQQQLTEQMAFKGTMSALACGVLLVMPPVLLLSGWVADLLGLPMARFWPHALLGMLALFLGMQLIPKLLFSPSEESPDKAIDLCSS